MESNAYDDSYDDDSDGDEDVDGDAPKLLESHRGFVHDAPIVHAARMIKWMLDRNPRFFFFFHSFDDGLM